MQVGDGQVGPDPAVPLGAVKQPPESGRQRGPRRGSLGTEPGPAQGAAEGDVPGKTSVTGRSEMRGTAAT